MGTGAGHPTGGATLSGVLSELTTDYTGNHIYEDGEWKMTLFPGGYIRQDPTPVTTQQVNGYHYYNRDYPGNNRAGFV
jgi:hypothetical protein